MPRLLADIGGTHSRLALATDACDRPQRVRVFTNSEWADPVALMRQYIDTSGADAPEAALIAVAGPVRGGMAQLTNIDWQLSEVGLGSALGMVSVRLINDFAAFALAVPHLRADEMDPIGGGQAIADAPVAVIGPGTGLGVAGLVRTDGGWTPVTGEGGHVTLPAATSSEDAIINRLRRRFGHVSAERVLSGPGLVVLHETLCAASSAQRSKLSPETVCDLARAGDPAAAQALQLFFALLGTVAGDLALTLGARGGVYLGGGILPQLRPELTASAFRERFEDKGRFRSYLESIPVYLITAREPTLIGLASIGGYAEIPTW